MYTAESYTGAKPQPLTAPAFPETETEVGKPIKTVKTPIVKPGTRIAPSPRRIDPNQLPEDDPALHPATWGMLFA